MDEAILAEIYRLYEELGDEISKLSPDWLRASELARGLATLLASTTR